MNGNSATQVRHVALALTAGAAAGASGSRLAADTARADAANEACRRGRSGQVDVDHRAGGSGASATATRTSTATSSSALTTTTAAAAVGALRRSLAAVVVLLDEMVAGAEGDQVSIVGGRRYAHTARASHVRVAQLIGERLELVGREVVVVPEDVVVRGPAGALDAGVAAQVEVELGGMSDAGVDGGAGRYVAAAAALLLAVGAEEARVVALLHGDEGDARLVAGLQLHARLAYRHQLVGQHGHELALGDAVAVEYDAHRFEVCRLVELYEQLFDHVAQLGDDLLAMELHAHRGRIATRMSVHGGDDGRYGRLGLVARGRMSHVGADEYDRLAEHVERTLIGQQDVVHAAQFHVDFETQIGERLRRRLVHVLRLHALRRQTDQSIANAFHFGVHGRLARQHDHNELQTHVLILFRFVVLRIKSNTIFKVNIILSILSSKR